MREFRFQVNTDDPTLAKYCEQRDGDKMQRSDNDQTNVQRNCVVPAAELSASRSADETTKDLKLYEVYRHFDRK